MRGDDGICGNLFSYIDLEERVRADHPLRVIRQIANAALSRMGPMTLMGLEHRNHRSERFGKIVRVL